LKVSIFLNSKVLTIQGNTKIGLLSNLATLICHPLWNYFYLVTLEKGVLGPAYAFVSSRILQSIIYVFYIKFSDTGLDIETPNLAFIKGMISYLKYSLPAGILMILEFWAYELLSIIAMKFGDIQNASSVIIMSIMTVIYGLADGFGIAALIVLGDILVTSSKEALVKAEKYIYIFSMGFSIPIVLFLIIFKQTISTSLSSHQAVTDNVENLIFLVEILTLSTMNWVILSNILKSQSQHLLASKITFFCLYCIEFLFILFFSFYLDLQVFGNWLSVLLAQLLSAGLFAYYIFNLEYKELRKNAIQQIENDSTEIKLNLS